MPDGLFITFWYRPKGASYQVWDVAVIDFSKESFAEWYLEAVHQYRDKQELRIASVVPLSKYDIESLSSAVLV